MMKKCVSAYSYTIKSGNVYLIRRVRDYGIINIPEDSIDKYFDKMDIRYASNKSRIENAIVIDKTKSANLIVANPETAVSLSKDMDENVNDEYIFVGE